MSADTKLALALLAVLTVGLALIEVPDPQYNPKDPTRLINILCPPNS